MSYVVIVGSHGRMAKVLQDLCTSQGTPFRLYAPDAPANLKVENFKNSLGVIDFSLPEVAPEIAQKVIEAKVPWVCGTTGWKSQDEFNKIFLESSKACPVVWDSNFSLGVEILCQMTETLAKKLNTNLSITDIHHVHKRDAPSGTALKIGDRAKNASPNTKVDYNAIRIGEVPGEHRVLISFNDETIELVHRAHSRNPFGEGAIKALAWAKDKPAGLYSMKDVLK